MSAKELRNEICMKLTGFVNERQKQLNNMEMFALYDTLVDNYHEMLKSMDRVIEAEKELNLKTI